MLSGCNEGCNDGCEVLKYYINNNIIKNIMGMYYVININNKNRNNNKN